MNQVSKNDFPAPLAFLLLMALGAGYLYIQNPGYWKQVMDQSTLFINIYPNFCIVMTAIVCLNIAFLFWKISCVLKSKDKFGNSNKDGPSRVIPVKIKLQILGLGILSFVPTYLILIFYFFSGDNVRFRENLIYDLIKYSCINVGIFVISFFYLYSKSNFTFIRFKNKLPKFPHNRNSIVLGSIESENKTEPYEWVKLNQKALNGNILITGSPGVGKTQGTILPYLEQIVQNFDPTPSILLIDPKGTFIPNALEIFEKNCAKDRILHLRLGGNVSFNPIFIANPLKDAKYLEIAQMIRGAAINYIGKAFESPFWEISSFNLIKNSLIYCAAVSDYYTLKDLYECVISASNSTDNMIVDGLKKALEVEKYNEEEKYNIECAKTYFESEFKQLDEKVRTGILATSTSFLNQFQDYHAGKIFCPTQEDISVRSMDEIVDQGKFLLLDIKNPALAKSMGTFLKLHYEQSLLNRLSDPSRLTEQSGVLIIDEYQDVVTIGGGSVLGDERFLSKSREANAISIMASQSLISLQNSIGKESAAKELFQNFRTRIAGHSSDTFTIKVFQELIGEEDREKQSHSFSETSLKARLNLFTGGYGSDNSNISQSMSTSYQRESIVTGKDFSSLKTFEAFAQIYDGVGTTFKKIYLKPYYLTEKTILHSELIKQLSKFVASFILSTHLAFAFPNFCSVVNTPEFSSCMEFTNSTCTCPGYPPRPCSLMTYYIPETFIETYPNKKESFFTNYPGASLQLNSVSSNVPFGAESDDDTQSFQARTINIPLSQIPLSLLPCGGERSTKFCFDAMSEHIDQQWKTGTADQNQPAFLAWSLSPKACLIKGAVSSVTGGSFSIGSGSDSCSMPLPHLSVFPPSSHDVCNGWGIFFPRYGSYNGPSQTIGALMMASRIKSLGTEVFMNTPGSADEKWQMISPQSSSCFREGQNIGFLETAYNVHETQRLMKQQYKGHLFVTWKRVSCCKELSELAQAKAAIAGMELSCKAFGGSP